VVNGWIYRRELSRPHPTTLLMIRALGRPTTPQTIQFLVLMVLKCPLYPYSIGALERTDLRREIDLVVGKGERVSQSPPTTYVEIDECY
jgi:hypothetical protein